MQVKPRLAYLIVALNIAVYLYGLSLRFSEGEDGPLRYFNSLANINAGIEGGEYYRYAAPITLSFFPLFLPDNALWFLWQSGLKYFLKMV